MNDYRPLTTEEIEVLKHNDCWAEDWTSVNVSEDFKPNFMHRVMLYGEVNIGAFNKIDNYSWVEKEEDDLTPMEKENIPLEDLKKTWMAKLNEDCLFISAKNKENIDEFREILYKKVRELHVQKYPYNDFLYQDYE